MKDSIYEEMYGEPEAPAKYDKSPFNWRPMFAAILIVGMAFLGFGIYKIKDYDWDKVVSYEEISYSFNASQVDSLTISLGADEVRVVESDDDMVHVTGTVPVDSHKVELNGSVLSVTNEIIKDPETMFAIFFVRDKKAPKLTVELPSKDYEEVKLSLSAGEMRAQGFDCNKLDIDVSAGSCVVTAVGAEKMDIDMSAGELEFNGCEASGMKLDCSAGEVSYNGSVNGDIDVDISAGSVKFDLFNNESEYVIKGLKDRGSSDGKYKINVDKTAGDISFDFGRG